MQVDGLPLIGDVAAGSVGMLCDGRAACYSVCPIDSMSVRDVDLMLEISGSFHLLCHCDASELRIMNVMEK